MNDQNADLTEPDADAQHYVEGMTEGRKKAFDLAAESTKQLLTLSTGAIVFSVTFLKDIFNVGLHKISTAGYGVLLTMWVFYLASAVAGIITLDFLGARALDPEPELAGSSAQSASRVQMLLFGIALVLTVLFGGLLAM